MSEIQDITATQDSPEAPEPAGRRGPRLKRKADEVFRGLWASLFYSGRTTGKSVLICSSDRREGSSTVACGLAVAGSEPAGVSRIALVDMNLRKPKLHKMLHVKASPGVANALLNGSAPEQAIQRISPSLDVYAAGDVGGRELQILRSENLERFLRDLASAYDHVLIDAAPVNHFPDAQVLARHIKDVVLVAHTQRTPREAVAQARKRIEAAGAKVAGLVLNRRTYPIPRFLYRRV